MDFLKPISIIVAIASNYAIGKDNKLLWHISADLKRFKQITAGHTVVMGKNTYYSLPKRPLPNRRNIVITDLPSEIIEGCEMAYSINEAISLCEENSESFIIGGGSVYRQFISIANKLYITRVQKEFEADTFFPQIDLRIWNMTEKTEITNDELCGFDYTYEIWDRKM